MTTAVPPAVAAAEELRGDVLLRYLGGRRWFGAKGDGPRGARVAQVVGLPWAGGIFALLQVEVDTASGALRYQLPVALRPEPPAGVTAIATVAGGRLFDATEDPEFRRELAASLARGCTVEFEGGRWIVEPTGTVPLTLPPDAEVTLGSAEQSNTSMRVGDAAILKLFRRLEPGEHPDVEVTRFLTVVHAFPHTPVLLGTMRWETADGVTVGGMVQELVVGATDAWAHALAAGRPYFAAPRGQVPDNAFAADAAQLGRVTRAMHETLAGRSRDGADATPAPAQRERAAAGSAADRENPAFAAEEAEEEELQEWAAAAERQVEEAAALLERQLAAGRISRERVEEARVVVRRLDHFLDLLDEIVEEIDDDAGQLIRHHGDYHLGQVLRTPSGEFMVIDFEGEPARSLADRRRRHSPLRDVAGMLRSFSYAAATLAADARRTAGASIDPATVEVRAGLWERDVRQQFLAGYFGGDAAPFLPRARGNAMQLLSLFEIEKVFYELAYELNNRPDWIGIPLRGIARLTTGRPA